MKPFSSLVISFAMSIAMTGCGGGDHKDHKDDAHKDHAGHKDDAHKEDAHKDHKDDAHGGHEHGGPASPLGKVDIGGFTVAVDQMGAAKAGGEGDFHLKVTGGTGKVKSVRTWIGTEDAKGSSKTLAKAEGEGSFDASADIPDPIPADGKLWIEIETDGGKKALGSIIIQVTK